MPNRMMQYRYRGSFAPPEHRQPVRASLTGTTNGQTATVRIDDVIDSWGGFWGISAREVSAMLDGLPDDVTTIDLELNSPGGEASEGVAIMNALRKHPAQVNATVMGIAASAASLIAMAADKLSMAPGAMFMIHDAWSIAMGNAEDMIREAAVIDKISQSYAEIYAGRAGGSVEDWRAAMKAESWYTASEAVDAGLADALVEDVQAEPVQARFDLSVFAHAGRDVAPEPYMPGRESGEQSQRVTAAQHKSRAVRAVASHMDTLTAAARTASLNADELGDLTDAYAAFGDLLAVAGAPVQSKASGSLSLPLSARGAAWDATAAEGRVRAWAGGGDSLDEMDWVKYRKAFFWFDDSKPENVGSHKLPFADVIDGELTAIWRGVTAAAGVISGARGGVDIPDADMPGVKARIGHYYDRAAHQYDDDSLHVPWGEQARAQAQDASHPGSGSQATAAQATADDSTTGTAMGISPDSVRMLADLAEAEAS